MGLLRGLKQVIVDSDAEFDKVLHEHAIEIEFGNEAEETKYEKTDSCLADLIQSLLVEIFGAANEGILFHQNFDWWPTCTRFLEIDSLCVTWDLIQRLRTLLIGSDLQSHRPRISLSHERI